MKRRIVAEHKSGAFSIPLKTNQYVDMIGENKYAILEKHYDCDSATTIKSYIQVFNADVFRVEDCCGGTDSVNCACK